ncbi:MAG: ISAzo13 family transposase, partial [Nitrospira sp.]|nr:ISAzo13 family transposase [Nitrospira sp.]
MDNDLIKRRFEILAPFLDERLRRIVAAAEAYVLGYGGISTVARATGVSRRAITEGCKEILEPLKAAPSDRIRRKGGGRESRVDQNP